MEIDVKAYLQGLKARLMAAPQQSITCNRSWARTFPQKPGAYLIRHAGQIVYTGETGNLGGRMEDIISTRNHTLRRSIGAQRFAAHPDYTKPTDRKKFCQEIEVLLNDFMSDELTIAYLEVELGRSELEEFIIETEAPIYNKKQRRKIR